jgi:formiminoglutamase
MSLSDFLSPLDLDSISPENGFYTSHLGSKIVAFHDDFPDLDSGLFDIALIGVLEDRNSINNIGSALAPDAFRQKFYELNEGNYNTRIVDLGISVPDIRSQILMLL